MSIKKTTTAKKSAVPKTVSKKPAVKKIVSKPSVIVETKKTKNVSSCSVCNYERIFSLIKFILLALILLFSLLNFFKKDGAWQLEELRVGGPENLNKAIEFYNSDYYKTAQTKGVEDALSQAIMWNSMSEAEIQNLINPSEELEFDIEDLE